TNQTGRSYQPPAALAYATTYYWQITAKGTNGSTAGPVWSFTTIEAPPESPSGPSPASEAAGVATSTSLTWAGSARATTYDVAFGTSSPPAVVSIDQASPSYTPSEALAPATKYYWRITARGPGGSTAGPEWSFTTVAPPPPPPPPTAPAGPSPANASTDIAPSTPLTWTTSDGATTYDVAFGTSNAPTIVSTDQAG